MFGMFSCKVYFLIPHANASLHFKGALLKDFTGVEIIRPSLSVVFLEAFIQVKISAEVLFMLCLIFVFQLRC